MREDVNDRKLRKPEAFNETYIVEEIRKHKETSDLYCKSNSYAKSMITSAVTDEVYQKIKDKKSASDAWEALKLQFLNCSFELWFQIHFFYHV